MLTIKQTETFRKWRASLKNDVVHGLIASRLDRLAFFGHAGDAKTVAKGVCELRIHTGPGYRIYYQQRGDTLVILLCGGDKSTQEKDIKEAIRLAAEWSDAND